MSKTTAEPTKTQRAIELARMLAAEPQPERRPQYINDIDFLVGRFRGERMVWPAEVCAAAGELAKNRR